MKIGIFSDTHIGPSGDAVDSETGLNLRLLDQKTTLNRMVDTFIERNVDLVLFGGDGFKGLHAKPHPTHAAILGDAFIQLTEAGIHVVGIVGNHDLGKAAGENHALFDTRNRRNLHFYDRPQIVDYTGGLKIIVLPYPNRNLLLSKNEKMTPEEADMRIKDILVAEVNRLAAQIPPGCTSILLGHVGLDMAKVGTESKCLYGRDIYYPLAQIPDNIDWVFWGHIHKPQYIPRVGRPHWNRETFSYESMVMVIGSLEQTDFGEEGEEKRFLILDTGTGQLESIPTGCREHQTFEFNVTDPSAFAQVGRAAMTPKPDAIVRVKLKLNRGQQFDSNSLKRDMLMYGAFSVQIIKEYEEELRRVSTGSEEIGETHESRLRAYCTRQSIAGEKQDTLVKAGLSIIQEVEAV